MNRFSIFFIPLAPPTNFPTSCVISLISLSVCLPACLSSTILVLKWLCLLNVTIGNENALLCHIKTCFNYVFQESFFSFGLFWSMISMCNLHLSLNKKKTIYMSVCVCILYAFACVLLFAHFVFIHILDYSIILCLLSRSTYHAIAKKKCFNWFACVLANWTFVEKFQL